MSEFIYYRCDCKETTREYDCFIAEAIIPTAEISTMFPTIYGRIDRHCGADGNLRESESFEVEYPSLTKL